MKSETRSRYSSSAYTQSEVAAATAKKTRTNPQSGSIGVNGMLTGRTLLTFVTRSLTVPLEKEPLAWAQQLAQQKHGHHARRGNHAFAYVFCQRKSAKRTALSLSKANEKIFTIAAAAKKILYCA